MVKQPTSKKKGRRKTVKRHLVASNLVHREIKLKPGQKLRRRYPKVIGVGREKSKNGTVVAWRAYWQQGKGQYVGRFLVSTFGEPEAYGLAVCTRKNAEKLGLARAY